MLVLLLACATTHTRPVEVVFPVDPAFDGRVTVLGATMEYYAVEGKDDFLTRNGVMDPGLLYEPPFTDSDPDGVEGMFADEEVDRIVAIVRGFNATVGVSFGERSTA